MKITVGAKTDIGRAREANEDSYLAETPLFVVADGMGGHIAGDVASSTAVEVIHTKAGDSPPTEPDSVVDLVRAANAAIWKKAQADGSLRGMGTTCTLIVVDEGRAFLAHVGDSRAYLLRDGELRQLTQDHTLVGQMVREGRLTPDQAERHPQRSILTRALGVESDVRVDIDSVELREGDRLLLCSDGLTAMITTDEVKAILTEEADPQAAAERLVQKANDAGGEDNITVVVVDLGGEARGAATAPAPERDDLPEREDTAPSSADDTGYEMEAVAPPPPPRRRWLRTGLVAVAVIAVIAGLGYWAARYSLDHSWYVGVDEQGAVTIYRGIPDEILGMTLAEPEQTTDLTLDELPEFRRADLEEGITVDSLEEAEATVGSLEDLASDPEIDQRKPKNK